MTREIKQRIEWYEKSDFAMDNPGCDFCSEDLKVFPVPVKSGYALCPKCQKKCGIHPGDTVFFESYRYNLGLEGKNLGVNCGGRK